MRTDGPYDEFERKVMMATEDAQRRHALIPLMVAIVLLIGLGATSTVFSVRNARATDAASTADVERNADLTRRLTSLTQQLAEAQNADTASAVAFRNDSRRLQLAICDQIEAVARQAHLDVPPCPRVPLPTETPSPRPAPTPSPPS